MAKNTRFTENTLHFTTLRYGMVRINITARGYLGTKSSSLPHHQLLAVCGSPIPIINFCLVMGCMF